jgi:putative hydrolase of the HAD superfamily
VTTGDDRPPVRAVIFDWGGTLTPWRTMDPADEWAALAGLAAPGRVGEAAAALLDAAETVWARSRDEHRSATLEEICALAGVPFDEAHLTGYQSFWERATFADEDVLPLFSRLKVDGLKVGVLSNTVWPRAWHEDYFRRDGVLEMLDGAVYTSEIPWTKPSPHAFRAAMEAVGVSDPARCVYVGDRLFDDVWGAQQAGMRAVHIPLSAIPAEQVGHTVGTPDGIIQALGELPGVLARW